MKNLSMALLPFALISTTALGGYEQLVSRSKPAVLQLEIETDEDTISGTGFFISPNGYFLTNAHMVADVRQSSDLTVTGCDGADYKVRGLVYSNKDDDLAIVKVDAVNAPYLEIDPDDDLMEGQTILVIGNPKHFTGTVSAGLISAIRKDDGVVQISAPISHGSSGSPVLNEKGEVVAVVVGLNDSGQNLNFCIPLDKIRAALAAIPAKSTPAGLADHSPRPEIRNQTDAEASLDASYRALFNSFDRHSQVLLREEEIEWLTQRERLRDDPDAYLQATMSRIHLLRASLILNQ